MLMTRSVFAAICAFLIAVASNASAAQTVTCKSSDNASCVTTIRDLGDFTLECDKCTLPQLILTTQSANKKAFVCTRSPSGKYECKKEPGVDLSSEKGLQNDESLLVIKDGSAPAIQEVPTEAGGLGFLPMPEWQQSLKDLNLKTDGYVLGNYYDELHDRAVVFIDADGTPFYPMLDVIDENDDLWVVIVDRTERMKKLEVTVQGCTPAPVEPRVYGAIPSAGLKSAGYPNPPDTARIYRAIGKCGAGTVTVTTKNAKGETHTTPIPINPLYRFSVGVAAAFDSTPQRKFDVRTAYGDSVPRVAQSEEPLGLSSLVFVSMYFVARDFHKTAINRPGRVTQRLQAFVGLDPANLAKNLVVGLGFELTSGFNVLVGWRALTSQPVLAEGSGLTVGSAFAGSKDSLPLRDRWEVGQIFLGVGVTTDLLAKFR